jgi:AbrB family looped-hinge helix DNA binding protein
MSKGITITNKGRFTLPAHIRRKLQLNEQGDTLVLEFDEKK